MRLVDPLADEIWRHQDIGFDPGGGGAPSPFDPGPLGPSDPSLGTPLGPEWQPPPSLNYNPGPSRSGNYGGGGGGQPGPPPAPPPDIFAGFLGPEIDQAKQIVQSFLTNMGFPHDLDANQLTLQLLNARLTGNFQEAAGFLFYQGQGITEDMRNASPWAQFGMDAGTYSTRKEALDDTFNSLIGGDPAFLQRTGGTDLQTLYYQALRGGFSQQQILQHLDVDPQFKQLLQDQPWLVSGQGFAQARQTFGSIYGSAPVDTPTLAAWWRFNTGAQQLSRTGREAVTTAAPVTSTSEGR